eukprot:CAMPEP_0119342508 /NCGR_PEP_ID=MMETSP1333-20130426/104872_1 /TAXON_ID=418940 /ORGANISM="Scyphosphaera apsteinii, Strain RCC1455" /LENGTH=34 /DNA_ID= /DNA_START= /DNA_END= /DNA_ORIENTATION=
MSGYAQQPGRDIGPKSISCCFTKASLVMTLPMME